MPRKIPQPNVHSGSRAGNHGTEVRERDGEANHAASCLGGREVGVARALDAGVRVDVAPPAPVEEILASARIATSQARQYNASAVRRPGATRDSLSRTARSCSVAQCASTPCCRRSSSRSRSRGSPTAATSTSTPRNQPASTPPPGPWPPTRRRRGARRRLRCAWRHPAISCISQEPPTRPSCGRRHPARPISRSSTRPTGPSPSRRPREPSA